MVIICKKTIMKKLFVFALFFAVMASASAQQPVSKVTVSDEDIVYAIDNELGYQKEASFPGGEKAMLKFINKNVVYPRTAMDNGISGTVIVGFVVEKSGEITNVEVVGKVSKELDEEAVRVVMKMPKWKPGTVEGEPVRSYQRLPIHFQVM